MRKQWFVETYKQHAQRLGMTEHQVKIHRIILQHKRSDITDLEWIRDEMGPSNCPTHVLTKSIPELEYFLRVVFNEESGMYYSDGFRASQAAVELAASLKELSRDGNKQERARLGLHNGHPPYGYREGRRVSVPVGKRRFVSYQLVVDPEPAAVIREIFAGVIAAQPLEEIAAALNADEIPAADGAWSGDKIRDVLRRAPVYAGYVIYRPDTMKNDRWRGILYPARYHEPILEWETVLEMLAAQGRECLWEFDATVGQPTAKE